MNMLVKNTFKTVSKWGQVVAHPKLERIRVPWDNLNSDEPVRQLHRCHQDHIEFKTNEISAHAVDFQDFLREWDEEAKYGMPFTIDHDDVPRHLLKQKCFVEEVRQMEKRLQYVAVTIWSLSVLYVHPNRGVDPSYNATVSPHSEAFSV